jgi:hypothetical protein
LLDGRQVQRRIEADSAATPARDVVGPPAAVVVEGLEPLGAVGQLEHERRPWEADTAVVAHLDREPRRRAGGRGRRRGGGGLEGAGRRDVEGGTRGVGAEEQEIAGGESVEQAREIGLAKVALVLEQALGVAAVANAHDVAPADEEEVVGTDAQGGGHGEVRLVGVDVVHAMSNSRARIRGAR